MDRPILAEDIERELQKLESLAYRLENLLPIPGTDIRLGLESILGLIPVIGDILGLIPAAHIVQRAYHHGTSRRRLTRMCFNIGVDVVIGFIPLVGDLFDVGWKANTRNVALLRRHLETQTAHTKSARAAILIDPKEA